ncbi:MAG: DinB family protein [SAR324 cluster bacterium]|nr:DinB family protein [SAR324 cluster bacterium]
MLSPDELRRRIDRILELAQQALRACPDALLETKPTARERTLRNLGYHVFRISAAFVDSMEDGRYLMEWFKETAPEAMADGAALAEFGGGVRQRLAAWFATAPAELYAKTTETFYGECTIHELLERTTWHAAQHMRQIYHVLEKEQIIPGGIPDPAVLDDLPLPREMW